MPLLKEEEVKEELKRSHNADIIHALLNVTELTDSFKIDVAVPGVKKEDFLIHADENVLSVCAVHKKYGIHEPGSFELHEFNYECFDRYIILPENVDIEFVSAKYEASILCLYIPKTNHPSKNLHTTIIVYY